MLNLSLSSSPGFTFQNPKLFSPHSLSSHHSLTTTTTTTTFFNPKTSVSTTITPTRKLSLKSRHSEYLEPRTATALPPRVFVGHSIYKGKAALTVEPRPPEFSPLDSGAFKLSKEGFVLLQFAPAAGVRQYDWSRKQVFSLSVTEMGTIMSLGARDSCEFFHDPFKGKSS